MVTRRVKSNNAAKDIARIESPEAEPVAAKPGIDMDILNGIVGYSLRRAQWAVYQDYARTVGELDMRPAQFAALSIIGANPGLSQTTLAATMGIDRSGAVTLIDALEDKTLARRVPAPNDRRTYAIVLTPEGQEMLIRLKDLVAQHDARVTQSLSESERLLLIELLQRLY